MDGHTTYWENAVSLDVLDSLRIRKSFAFWWINLCDIYINCSKLDYFWKWIITGYEKWVIIMVQAWWTSVTSSKAELYKRSCNQFGGTVKVLTDDKSRCFLWTMKRSRNTAKIGSFHHDTTKALHILVKLGLEVIKHSPHIPDGIIL